MTLPRLSIPKNYIYAAFIALAILTIGLVLLHNVAPIKRDLTATAFLIDITITFPVIYYFLVIRPNKLKKWRLVFVFTCCCGVAYLILPAHQRHYIVQLRKLTVCLELGVVIYGITQVRKIRAAFNRLQAGFTDTAFNFNKSMTEVLGTNPVVKFLSTELTILYFGLFWWRKQKPFSADVRSFSIYKESGYAALFGVILAVCVIEVVAFHLFLMHYSNIAAVILTVLSIYSIIFIIGDFSAIVKSPVIITQDQLLLRTGLRWRALINKTDIASVEKIRDSYEPGENCFKGGIMKGSVNVLITFNNPVLIERLYRKSIYATQIILCVDEAERFIGRVNYSN
ncbi:MAG: hypothetical protein JWQ34_3775 [Mucilaginibacter sp.]|uniref:hypothetical protein n=1 Tax=Mucilaginibacter sp. TaxID=1882438 RepID=UPI002639302B|nr:hypothetical protein [Mucilaginibacter sp.]MDB5005550.1 hypothetical protein [Mucilaginibacter sp.]